MPQEQVVSDLQAGHIGGLQSYSCVYCFGRRTSTQIVAPNDPQPPLDAGQPDLLETRLLKVTDLIQLIKSRLAVIGLEGEALLLVVHCSMT